VIVRGFSAAPVTKACFPALVASMRTDSSRPCNPAFKVEAAQSMADPAGA